VIVRWRRDVTFQATEDLIKVNLMQPTMTKGYGDAATLSCVWISDNSPKTANHGARRPQIVTGRSFEQATEAHDDRWRWTTVAGKGGHTPRNT
jgi:hypothetical protein